MLINLGTECRYGPRSNILAKSGPLVEAVNATVSPTQIDDIRILGIGRHISTFASARGKPIAWSDLAVIGSAWHRSASAILLRAVHDVGELVVGDHMIELCRGLVVPRTPSLAAVETDCGALIRPKNHAGRILRIDPNLVVIITTRCAADDRNCLPSVFGSVKSDIWDIDYVGIACIDRNARLVRRGSAFSRIQVLPPSSERYRPDFFA